MVTAIISNDSIRNSLLSAIGIGVHRSRSNGEFVMQIDVVDVVAAVVSALDLNAAAV